MKSVPSVPLFQRKALMCLVCGGAIMPDSEVRCRDVRSVRQENYAHVLYEDPNRIYIIACGRRTCPSVDNLQYGTYRGIRAGRPDVAPYPTDHPVLREIAEYWRSRR